MWETDLTVPLLSAKRSMTCAFSITLATVNYRGLYTCNFVGLTAISELVTVAIVAVDGGGGCGCFQAKQKERA
jgi:hypothetical protein